MFTNIVRRIMGKNEPKYRVHTTGIHGDVAALKVKKVTDNLTGNQISIEVYPTSQLQLDQPQIDEEVARQERIIVAQNRDLAKLYRLADALHDIMPTSYPEED